MIVGVYGHSNSGKTQLIEQMLDYLKSKGKTVAIIKHTLGKFSMDTEGKDTQRYIAHGADLSTFCTAKETTFVIPKVLSFEKVYEITTAINSFDVVIIEGWKELPGAKIAVGDIPELPETVLRYQGDFAPVKRYLDHEFELRDTSAA